MQKKMRLQTGSERYFLMNISTSSCAISNYISIGAKYDVSSPVAVSTLAVLKSKPVAERIPQGQMHSYIQTVAYSGGDCATAPLWSD